MYLPYLSSSFRHTTLNPSKAIAVRGCNMSFWKEDLIKVNGYDEEMTGWGREDSEISARLVHNRIKKGINY
jgi:predicted glycosyltransferase involved in capsule biosynthesis